MLNFSVFTEYFPQISHTLNYFEKMYVQLNIQRGGVSSV